MPDFRQSKLWRLAFERRRNDPFESARERLKTAYNLFWERGVELAQRISADLPGLTLHDERHLTALWDRASQLTGDNWEINPLEAFVFGGAILMHDAGHALAAYEGGVEELKQTIEYKDTMAAVLKRGGGNSLVSISSEELLAYVLFVTLRKLHAKQAQNLPERRFRGLYLIEDPELRANLAQLIGIIAASHNWGRETLEDKLPKKRGAPGFLPQEWSIPPVKLACLLRCADAIQIDQRRTPAFAHALHAPVGESELHWLAQQLAQPIVIPDENRGPGALVFTSQNDFTEDKADAWWVAHDLIRTANQELEGCYELMKDLGFPAFTVDRVSGAESPIRLSYHVRTAGWRPVNAEVRVSSVQKIVDLFGGQLLYGRNLAVPLRELIQNASDAVRARRRLDSLYQGKVVVSLVEKDDCWQLIVEDDGIGMSERVITGPLLEFGKSFWASEDLQEEFPGLASANLRQGGRYGIGFFSTLMIAKRVEVISRRWDAAQDAARKLTLRDGLRLRPLISTRVEIPLNQFSTRVILYVEGTDVEDLLTIRWQGQGGYKIDLKELVAHICTCLDCDVYVLRGTTLHTAHSRDWQQSDARQWVNDIVLAAGRTDEPFHQYLGEIAPLIRVIGTSQGEDVGRAAIAFGQFNGGVDSVDGLVSAGHLRSIGNLSQAYVGSIGFDSSGPRRDAGELRSSEQVRTWASEQAELIGQLKKNAAQNYLAAMNVAEFGGDATPIATILVNRKFVSLPEVYDMLCSGEGIFVVIGGDEMMSGPSISMVTYRPNPHYGLGFVANELDFPILVMEAWNGRRFPDRVYHRIATSDEAIPSCYLSCLENYVNFRGKSLQSLAVPEVLFATYKGETSARENLAFGTELHGASLKLFV